MSSDIIFTRAMAQPSPMGALLGRKGSFDQGSTSLEAQARLGERAIDRAGNLVRRVQPRLQDRRGLACPAREEGSTKIAGQASGDRGGWVEEKLADAQLTAAGPVPIGPSISPAGNFRGWTPLYSLLVSAELTSIGRTGELLWTTPAARRASVLQLLPEDAMEVETAAVAHSALSITSSSIGRDGNFMLDRHVQLVAQRSLTNRAIDCDGNFCVWSHADAAKSEPTNHYFSGRSSSSISASASTCETAQNHGSGAGTPPYFHGDETSSRDIALISCSTQFTEMIGKLSRLTEATEESSMQVSPINTLFRIKRQRENVETNG